MPNSAHVSHKLKGQKRLEGETYKEYKKRLRKEKKLVKNYLKGELVWYPGGKRSQAILLLLVSQNKLELEVARQIFKRGQGTLKGNPTGRINPNTGLPIRKKPVLRSSRAKN